MAAGSEAVTSSDDVAASVAAVPAATVENGRTAVLSVRNVSKTFGKLIAVRDVSFDVAGGEVFGLAGPNGAGKSTLFNTLTCVPFGPDAGTVELDGARVSGRSAHRVARAGLARTFQTESVFDDLSVSENVRLCATRTALGARGRSSHASAAQALRTVGLHGSDSPARTLSLVDRKRLMIATAIVGQPRVLLLDEPAAGLEPQDQDGLIALLRDINASGVTILIVEHVLRVLRELCTRMAVLDAGALIAAGTPKDVLADPVVVQAYLGPGAVE